MKRFPDDLLENPAFTGMESTGDIAPGLVFGCVPNHPFLKAVLDDYNNSHFIVGGKETPITVNSRITDMMINAGYLKNGKEQIVNDIVIYSSEIFCGYDLDVFEPNITEKNKYTALCV